MKPRIEALVFDFFGVICSEIAPHWLGERFTASEAAELKASLVGAADRGRIPQKVLFERLSDLTGESPQSIEADWFARAKIDWTVESAVRALSMQYPIGLLTNSPSPLFRRILKDNGLADIFSAIVVSSEQGLAKPDIAIYRLMLDEMDVSPEQTVFIDDNPVNVQGAVDAGIHGVCFESLHQMERSLREIL